VYLDTLSYLEYEIAGVVLCTYETIRLYVARCRPDSLCGEED